MTGVHRKVVEASWNVPGKAIAGKPNGASPTPAAAPLMAPAELHVPGDVVLLLQRGSTDRVSAVCVDGTYTGLGRLELSSGCFEQARAVDAGSGLSPTLACCNAYHVKLYCY